MSAHLRHQQNRFVTSASETARSDPAGAGQPSGARPSGRSRADQARLAVAAVLGGLTVAFALLNTGDVEVNWILGTFSTPLIVVIVVSLLIGGLFGFALGRRGRPGGGAKAARRSADSRG
jgi:uncharacterized integral membrane protein